MGAIYAKYHKSIIYILLIKGITVLHLPNQAHNCIVWLIEYSYAVDFYFMNYMTHFFASILPHKVQYNCISLYIVYRDRDCGPKLLPQN